MAFVGILTALNLTLYDNYYLWQREKSLDRIYDTVRRAYAEDGSGLAAAIVSAEDTEGVRLSIVTQEGTVTYDSVVREQLAGMDGASQNLFYGLSIAEAALRAVDLGQVEKQGSACCERVLPKAERGIFVPGRPARRWRRLSGRAHPVHVYGAEFGV